MKKILPLLAAIIVAISFTSCQKEISTEIGNSNNSGNNNNGNNGNGNGNGTSTGTTPGDISGDWEFINAYVKTKATDSYSFMGQSAKIVTTTEYTTADNHGSLNIGATKMTSTDLGYSASTMMHMYMYTNNVLAQHDSLPFYFNVPSSSGESPYKRINADSVYFETGFVNLDKDKLTSTPGGARIRIDAQGVLSFTMSIYQAKTDNSNGYPEQLVEEATTVVYYKRK